MVNTIAENYAAHMTVAAHLVRQLGSDKAKVFINHDTDDAAAELVIDSCVAVTFHPLEGKYGTAHIEFESPEEAAAGNAQIYYHEEKFETFDEALVEALSVYAKIKINAELWEYRQQPNNPGAYVN